MKCAYCNGEIAEPRPVLTEAVCEACLPVEATENAEACGLPSKLRWSGPKPCGEVHWSDRECRARCLPVFTCTLRKGHGGKHAVPDEVWA